jgi:uncharacterized membrane protein HdeD (DUF308 family)
VFWVAVGLVQTIGSIVDRPPNWGWELAAGLLSIAAGILAIAWPGITLLAVAIIAGAWMIVIGVIQLMTAFRGPTPRSAAVATA